MLYLDNSQSFKIIEINLRATFMRGKIEILPSSTPTPSKTYCEFNFILLILGLQQVNIAKHIPCY